MAKITIELSLQELLLLATGLFLGGVSLTVLYGVPVQVTPFSPPKIHIVNPTGPYVGPNVGARQPQPRPIAAPIQRSARPSANLVTNYKMVAENQNSVIPSSDAQPAVNAGNDSSPNHGTSNCIPSMPTASSELAESAPLTNTPRPAIQFKPIPGDIGAVCGTALPQSPN